MVKPTDRSMPAEMMMKVWPSASSSGATARTLIDCRLYGFRMKVVVDDPGPGLEEHDQQDQEQPGPQLRRPEQEGPAAAGWREGIEEIDTAGGSWSRKGQAAVLRRPGGSSRGGSAGVEEPRHLRVVDVRLVHHGEAGADRGRHRLLGQMGEGADHAETSRSRPGAGRWRCRPCRSSGPRRSTARRVEGRDLDRARLARLLDAVGGAEVFGPV